MAPLPIQTGALIARQFGDIGGAVTGAAGDVGNKVTQATTTAAGAVTEAATTVGGAVGGAAQTVGGAVGTGAGAVGNAANTLGQLGSWTDQIKALQEAWQKYHEDIYIAATILLALFIIMILVSFYTCFKCCFDCCCRDTHHDHHDEKGACCGLCGGPALQHPDQPKPKIVPPERKGKVDWARLARGKRANFEGEKWNFWGRIGPKGHGSWFNRWVPRWLGGRSWKEDWGDAARAPAERSEEHGGEPYCEENDTSSKRARSTKSEQVTGETYEQSSGAGKFNERF